LAGGEEVKVRHVESCRACSSRDLSLILSLGWLPLANRYLPIGSSEALPFFPHELIRCDGCGLAQLGIVADSVDVFDKSYPYRSGVTKQLRDNFAELRTDVAALMPLEATDLVVDIGGNDGTLLSNFHGQRVNVTPEDMGRLSEADGVCHIQGYWGHGAASMVLAEYGKAKVITATNVFAHISDPSTFVEAVLTLLDHDGLFVVECQEFGDLVDGCQFDHLYLEHQLHWTISQCAAFMAERGLGVASYRRIPTHGGSFRLIFRRGAPAFTGAPPVDIRGFAARVATLKTDLWSLLSANYGAIVAGICAPSRATTFASYVGLDHNVIGYVCETADSPKLGRMMPGTRVPICDESELYRCQPDLALILAPHIALSLMPKLKANGFRGKFVTAIPSVQVIG